MTVDETALMAALERFGGTDAERRVVARQARDLSDAGKLRRDRDHALDIDTVVENLASAPSGGPAERWNWWLGALEAAHGGYAAFQVRRVSG